jgi:hypothetical protein
MFHRYVPMYIDGNNRLPVLEISGGVGMVGKDSKPASLPHFEVEMLRDGLNPRRVEPHHLVIAGRRGRMRADTLADIEGIVVREKGRGSRVVISLDPLIQSIAIEVDGEDVDFVDTSVPPTLEKIEEEIEQPAGTPLYQFSCLDSYPRPTRVISPGAFTH